MNWLTRAFKWVETRLDEGAWVRRVYLVLATAMTWKTTLWAFDYAAKNAERPGIEVAAVITAVGAIPAAIQTFAFKHYSSSKGDTP